MTNRLCLCILFGMKIIRADILGFCAGVRRAVEAAVAALEDAESKKKEKGNVYTLGPLIHNPVALKELADRKLRILDADEIASLTEYDTVLIRAHGIPPLLYRALCETGCAVINATCPLVTRNQRRAAELSSEGYTIIFAGDANHGETVGIQGFAEEAAKNAENNKGEKAVFLLVKTAEEAEKLFGTENESAAEDISTKRCDERKAVLLSQTTFSVKEFESIRAALKRKLPKIEVFNTICPATHERQNALVSLCARVDAVIVIGGKNSSNTNRLYATAKRLCANERAALIETPEEVDSLPESFFTVSTLGLTAGASTPDSVIDAVERKLFERAEKSLASIQP